MLGRLRVPTRVVAVTAFAMGAVFSAPALGAPQAVCASVPSGAVSWWRAESSGADAIGTNAGSAQGSVSYATGMTGQAFSLGGGGYVDAGRGVRAGTSAAAAQ